MKMTSVVGYIAVQDLTKASILSAAAHLMPSSPVYGGGALFLISWLLSLSLSYVEWVTDPKAEETGIARVPKSQTASCLNPIILKKPRNCRCSAT